MKNILDITEAGEYEAGQPVELIIHSKTDIGFKAIVDQKYWGVLFYQEVFQDLSKDQQIKGYIKRVREDGKLDLILYQEGNKDSDDIGQNILQRLEEEGGFLAVTDKSPPGLVYELFSVSKKKFKIGLGGLYKKRLIRIEEDGIHLVKSSKKDHLR